MSLVDDLWKGKRRGLKQKLYVSLLPLPCHQKGESLKSKFSLQLPDAFVVDEESLKKIHGLLSDRIGRPTISAECADDVTREYDDLASLVGYENAQSKQIVSLRLSARSDDFSKTSTVDFSDKWYFGGTSISIEARDDVVTRLRSALLDVLGGMRPWYHQVNKIDFWLAALIVYIFTWLLCIFYVVMYGSNDGNVSPKASAIGQLLVWGSALVLLGGAYSFHRFRRLLFPHGTFRIGQAKTRYDTLEKWRWGFVIAFLASFVAGIVLLVVQLTVQ